MDYAVALYRFIDQLSPAMMSRLYESPASCLSIFRLLPASARFVATSALFLPTPPTETQLTLLVGAPALADALSALRRLDIAHVSNGALELHPQFRTHLAHALTGVRGAHAFGTPADAPPVAAATLDAYAARQWERLLHFLVSSSRSADTRPSDAILRLLTRSGLMAGSPRSLAITSKGFQFLLAQVNTQLWDILLEYLAQSPDVVEVLGFVFTLGSLELGTAYATRGLSTVERRAMLDLTDYGLVYQTPDAPDVFYPTRLATTLTAASPSLSATLPGAPASALDSEAQGFLIVETNFKVYAYTSNPLQIAVLDLFLTLKSRFPNFVTAYITRDAIKGALENGITADQIISYLITRAHPQMKSQPGIIPTTVIDQIRLWEQERNRVQTTEGFLYDDFTAKVDYDLVAEYAAALDVVLWQSPAKRKLFVTADGHQQIREFIKRRMAGN